MNIEFITISTLGNAQDFGDLLASAQDDNWQWHQEQESVISKWKILPMLHNDI